MHFFQFLRAALSPQIPPFSLQWPKIYKKFWQRHQTGKEGLKKKWIFSKMLVKGMHQIVQIEFQTCNFLKASERGGHIPLRHPPVCMDMLLWSLTLQHIPNFLNFSIMSISKFVSMTKNTPVSPILHGFCFCFCFCFVLFCFVLFFCTPK